MFVFFCQIVTEMMFNGVFNEMTPEAIAALLSCLVFQEKVCLSVCLSVDFSLVASSPYHIMCCDSHTNRRIGTQGDENPKIRSELAGPLRQMQEVARRVAKVSQESKLQLDTEEYVKTINAALMEVVYSWALVRRFVCVFMVSHAVSVCLSVCRAPSLPICAR